jgi:hypothetical protein
LIAESAQPSASTAMPKIVIVDNSCSIVLAKYQRYAAAPAAMSTAGSRHHNAAFTLNERYVLKLKPAIHPANMTTGIAIVSQQCRGRPGKPGGRRSRAGAGGRTNASVTNQYLAAAVAPTAATARPPRSVSFRMIVTGLKPVAR